MLVLLQGQKQEIHTKLHKYPSLRSKIKGDNTKTLYTKTIHGSALMTLNSKEIFSKMQEAKEKVSTVQTVIKYTDESAHPTQF
jgi:hypothetical protein